MNLKRLLAGVLACCIVGGALPSFGESADKAVIKVSAADDDEYTEGTYESLTYRKYENYIEISGCDESATSVVIPAEIDGIKVIGIGHSAFARCSQLTSVVIPNGVTYMSSYVFYQCINLTSISLPESVTSFGLYVFSDTPWFQKKQEENPILIINGYLIDASTCSDNIIILDGVKKIGHFAFNGPCINTLKSVTIPNGVDFIGYGAFQGCRNLTELTIPNSVTLIGGETFVNCSALTSIVIPNNVISIGYHAFSSCSNLTSITVLNPECEIDDGESTISNGYDENDAPYFNGTIYGYDNSTAQAYAEKYDRKFVSLGAAPEKATEMGDIDGDGIIDSSDASIVLAEYSLLSTGKDSTLSESQKKLADLNKDGTIDSSDASLILAYYSHTATGGTDSIDVFLEKQGY